MPGEIRVNDVGTVFEVTIVEGGTAVDISTAQEMKIVLVKPDGSRLEVAPAFVTNGSDGRIQYTAVQGDLLLPGTYQIQATVQLPTGTWHTKIGSFFVYGNL